MGVHIEKSEKLTLEWAALLSKLDAFIKTIKRFKKYIGYSTAIVLILTFLFKMGIARQIPNFFCDLISHISLPSSSNNVPSPVAPIKEKTENIILEKGIDLLETPLTPLGILAGAGVIISTISILRVTLKLTKLLRRIK